MNRRRITQESVTVVRKPGGQEGKPVSEVKKTRRQDSRQVNELCHCEGVKRPKQSGILSGLPRSLRSLAMTMVNTDKDLMPYCLSALLPKRVAFTLAEVLITLGIIGVVAAITIPNMVANYQKKATVAKLKEDYAVFNQAIRRARAENGDYFANSEYAGLDKTMATFEHYLKPYLKISKICAPTDSSCWTDAVALNGVKETYMSQYSTGKNKQVSMILLNGQTVYIWASDNGASMQIWVNVNGLKNRAIIGKDVFGFLYDIGQGTLRFSVAQAGQYSTNTREDFLNNSTLGCNKSITGRWAGILCGALIEHDGWKISKDYPW